MFSSSLWGWALLGNHKALVICKKLLAVRTREKQKRERVKPVLKLINHH